MKKYRVLIHGTGYDIWTEDGLPLKGFFVSVFVEAPNVNEVGQRALDFLVNSEVYITEFASDQHPNARLHVEEVEELSSFDDVPCLISGFSFYEVDDVNGSKDNAPMIH